MRIVFALCFLSLISCDSSKNVENTSIENSTTENTNSAASDTETLSDSNTFTENKSVGFDTVVFDQAKFQ
jgi:hypothetical protein